VPVNGLIIVTGKPAIWSGWQSLSIILEI